MSLIQVKDLNFDYTNKHILKNINFEIAAGSITALVGPNGAGKTTLLRCMTSLETPMSGNVLIDGIDVHDFPREAHRQMGYLSDFFGVYDDLTVRQCLLYMGWCHKLPVGTLPAKIEEIAAEVDITKYLDQKAGVLSRGYRQRLGVGLTLVHNPKLLILDEPASGMDPEARIKFSELMLRLRNRGMTIIVSSHILAELEDYCTDMLVIREGEIRSHVFLTDHQVQAETVITLGIQNMQPEHLALLVQFENVRDVHPPQNNEVTFTFTGDTEKQAALLAHLIERKVPVFNFNPGKKTLKTAYMDLANDKESAAS